MRCSWVTVHDCHEMSGESGGDDDDDDVIACFQTKNCENIYSQENDDNKTNQSCANFRFTCEAAVDDHDV